MSLIKRTLRSGPIEINKRDLNGRTLLMKALSGNSRHSNIQLLIDAGTDVNIQDANGLTALMHAINRKQNSEDNVELLIKSGCDLDLRDILGRSALIHACLSGKSIQMLVDAGCNIHGNYSSMHDEHYNVRGKYYDPNEYEGDNALTYLCRYCDNRFVIKNAKILIEAGIDINHKNEHGKTALMLACERKNIGLIKLLLESGCDTEIVGVCGETALFTVIKCVVDYDVRIMVEILIKGNCNVNFRGKGNNTALMYTCQYNNYGVEKLLVNAGCDLDTQNDDGVSALMYACQYDKHEVVRLFVDSGCNLDLQDNNGMTALLYAINRYNKITVKFLIDSGCDVKVVDNYRRNVFMRIGRGEMKKLIKRLSNWKNGKKQKQGDMLGNFIEE